MSDEKNEKKVEIKLCEFFEEHWYRVCLSDYSTDYYPSVTTKLSIIDKPGLRRWYASLGEREARKRTTEAADKGSRIHHAAQIMAQGGAVIYQPIRHPNYDGEELFKLKKKYKDLYILEHQDEMLDVWKIKQFFAKVNPLIIGTEVIVYSVTNKEAGTIDLIFRIKEDCEIEGVNKEPLKLEKGIYIGDYKSGNLYDEARMQVSTYGAMLVEMSAEYKREIKGALLIHTGSKSRTGIPGLEVIKLTLEEMREEYVDFRHTAAMWSRKNKLAMPKLLNFPGLLVLGGDDESNS